MTNEEYLNSVTPFMLWGEHKDCPLYGSNTILFAMDAARGDEREKLKDEINRLKIDNMTHEYNQAEAERFAPEYERQQKEELDAAREDEAVGFSRFLYYGTWQTIGDNGEDMLYKSYKTGEEKFASELYQLYLKHKNEKK